ncbi:MAG: ATPase [Gammaproteobacteria bacterium RIFCSPHIGHO2_02_FULL_42_13]|nr:MAG: ATPase [Gammaproteobacteria bacterium RIFCSPHIGHO2_02_FULL_42_13]OGT70142.1 MAG: ATPase [Gammaproteobacteria bacterium RIFCSPLOWO2_02_FULL_42_9]
MFSRSLHKPLSFNKSFFLFGPRGVGKTQWLKSQLPHALYFDLLKAKWRNLFLADPGQLAELIPEGFTDWIILDEVQKSPRVLDEVHRLIETYHYKFILTGSSARKLKRQKVNLLAGRARTYYLYPLTASELGDAFDVKQYLSVGGLPEAYLSEDADEFLQSYISTYLYEEIMQESLARNLESFARFLQSASLFQGAVLNISAVARDCAVRQKTVASYFSILNDLLMSVHLPAFTRRAKRRLIQHDKFYLFDVGVYRAVRPRGLLDSTEEIDGPALETVFLQHLSALNEYYSLGYALSYWRTSDGKEVDFVLYGDKGFLAFEVKRTSTIQSSDVRGLKAFKADYPEAKCYLIYSGIEKIHKNDMTFLPLTYALKNLLQIIS